MQKIKAVADFMGINTKTPEEEKDECFPTLTLKERLLGFAICSVLGFLIELLSMGSLIGLFVGNPYKFGILFTLGNFLSVLGICLLVGPLKQLKNMVDKKRLVTSIVYVCSMIMTILSIYLIKSRILTLIFIIIQFMSYVWYSLSYIPWGREICTGCVKKIYSRL